MTYKFNPLLEFGLDEVGGGAEAKSFVGLIIDTPLNQALPANTLVKTDAVTTALDATTTTSDWEIVGGVGNRTELRYIGTQPKDFIFTYNAVVRKGSVGSGALVSLLLITDDGVTQTEYASSTHISTLSTYPVIVTAKSTTITLTPNMTITPYFRKGGGPTRNYALQGSIRNIILTGEQV